MKNRLSRIWREDGGALTFEWILLITLVVIGIVGGVSAVRDAVITELGDVSSAAVHIDQSYTVVADPTQLGNAFGFQDSLPECDGSGARPPKPITSQDPIEGCISE